MIKQITKNICQFSFKEFGSNIYLLKRTETEVSGAPKTKGFRAKEKILIDTSSKENRAELLEDLKKIGLNANDIQIVLLTHLHYDHVGNINLFKKAEIYASEIEIKDFQQDKNAFGPPKEFDNFGKVKFLPLSVLKIKNMEIIKTPGHTRGSVCFYLPKEKILFSGDTIFDKDAHSIGRTDLLTSVPDQMENSIKKLLSLDFKILCPGH